MPLSQLAAVNMDQSTAEAIGDWHLWLAQGYGFWFLIYARLPKAHVAPAPDQFDCRFRPSASRERYSIGGDERAPSGAKN